MATFEQGLVMPTYEPGRTKVEDHYGPHIIGHAKDHTRQPQDHEHKAQTWDHMHNRKGVQEGP